MPPRGRFVHLIKGKSIWPNPKAMRTSVAVVAPRGVLTSSQFGRLTHPKREIAPKKASKELVRRIPWG
jgi:hypothetical protein